MSNEQVTRMNLDNLISEENLRSCFLSDKIKRVFFYKICGAGMGPAAVLFKEAGFDVEGADKAYYPPMSTYLESTLIPLHQLSEIDESFLKNFDLIVVGNSLARNSQEARMIESCGVPFTSFPAALGTLILADKKVVGIAGTHGKTTTTYFLVQLLEKLGKKPGYLIGGILNDRSPSHLGEDIFIIESDEYDSAYFHKISKFRFYQINHLILTSLEFDHADIFTDMKDIEDQFHQVIPAIDGQSIFNTDYEACIRLSSHFSDDQNRRVTFYGCHSQMGPFDVKHIDGETIFSLRWQGKSHEFKTSVLGLHNILNLTSCVLFLLHEGFKVQELQEAVKKILMVKRRQELRGTYKETLVIDDFAHHPRAIKETIMAMKEKYSDKKMITVFEPISATARSSHFQEEFLESLAFSDKIIVAKSSLPTTALNHENLDVKKLVKELTLKGKEAREVSNLVDLRDTIDSFLDKNSLLLVLSNRTCLGLWESSFVDEIDSKLTLDERKQTPIFQGNGVSPV